MPNKRYTIKEIAKVVKGELYTNNAEKSSIDDLLIDSRKIISSHDNLFFALKSKRNDGHKYINELINKDVNNFIVSTLPNDYTKLEVNFILVKDSLIALQQVSAVHRSSFNIPIIGITGSNGKTIIKEWLYQCLHSDYSICRSPKSYNSQIGVPLSVFQLDADDKLGIFEAGISEPDEMIKLEKIIKPTIGILTNIGDAHQEHFIDIRQKVNEKLSLFVKSDVLIFCRDHNAISERIYSFEFFREKLLLDWSRTNKDATYYISTIDSSNNNNTILKCEWNGGNQTIEIPFADNASIENAIHIWITLLHLKIDASEIKSRMLGIRSIAMRMELKEGINNCSIINDSYNSDINALNIALDFLSQQQQHSKKTVILSDILQSGKSSDILYKEIAQVINNKNINRFIGIGKKIGFYKDLFHNTETNFYDTTQDFIDYFPFSSFNSETILLKGARNFRFERINKYLGNKNHQTRLEVDLTAMLDNFNYYRSILKPGVKIMAMVKAFSYGSGSFEVANLLQFHNADYLSVAYTDEGVGLRKAGIKLPIMVMNPEVEALESLISNHLEPEIYSFKILNDLIDILESRPLPSNKPIGIHIKLDTGMHRLGFESQDIIELITKLKASNRMIVKSVFSHLAASDESSFDEFTKQQISIFENLSKKITIEFEYPILLHIANSAAISRFPNAQFDMVRQGIALYGVGVDPKTQKNLKAVSKLKTIISQIKTIHKGDSVGYNRAFVADKTMRIATIPIGYADGYDRRFSNGVGKVMIKGKLHTIIGNVCMDMCMINLLDTDAKEGDDVCIFGDNPNIMDLASSIDTIPYEILTSISQRVKRIYIQE